MQIDIDRPRAELVAAYREVAPATLGHMHDIRIMDSGIVPLFPDVSLVGPAFTVRMRGMDRSALQAIEEHARPGDVVVVDCGGDHEHAIIGEFRALKQIRLGVAGWIVDGAATDVREIATMRFPTFSRSVSALVAKNLGHEGVVGVPVSCGGVVVRPGDLILADDNGVAVLSHEEAEAHLEHGLAVAARERRLREEYAEEYCKLVDRKTAG